LNEARSKSINYSTCDEMETNRLGQRQRKIRGKSRKSQAVPCENDSDSESGLTAISILPNLPILESSNITIDKPTHSENFLHSIEDVVNFQDLNATIVSHKSIYIYIIKKKYNIYIYIYILYIYFLIYIYYIIIYIIISITYYIYSLIL